VEEQTVKKEYLELTRLIERLHRRCLDLLRAELNRLGIRDINSVQALLLANIGSEHIAIRDLVERGYYQGSNVSYNLKKLVELGYMHHQRSEIDRRSVRVRLTEKGRRVRGLLADLFARHAEGLMKRGMVDAEGMEAMNQTLKRIERYWSDQIRYIY